MTAPDWSATAAWATFGVAFAAALFAGVQTLSARSDRRERQRPQVIAYLSKYAEHHGSVRLSIANIGKTTARDVYLEFDPPFLEHSTGDVLTPYVRTFVQRKWTYMPPGMVHDSFLVHLPEYPEGEPRAWNVKINCSDYKGRAEDTQTTRLDLDDISKNVQPDTLGLHALATSIKHLDEWLTKNLPVDSDGLHVVTETEHEAGNRRAAAREQQWLGRRRLVERLRLGERHSDQ